MDDDVGRHVISAYFEQKGQQLVKHQIDSYDDFVSRKLEHIIENFNPIDMYHHYLQEHSCYKYALNISISNPILSKPMILEKDGSTKIMMPNDARLRSLTYAAPLHVDVSITAKTYSEETREYTMETKKIASVGLGRIPVMVRSKYCMLQHATPSNVDECRYDYGGYFIINGNEKVIISQDRIAENRTYVFVNSKATTYSHTAEIRSVQEARFGVPKTTSLKLTSKANHLGRCIHVSLHHIRHEVPLFIVFRALGVESDLDIVRCIVPEDDVGNAALVEHLAGCIDEARNVPTTQAAIDYLCQYMHLSTNMAHAMAAASANIPFTSSIHPHQKLASLYITLHKDFLPHVGTTFGRKAVYMGYMVRKLLRCCMGIQQLDDRDSYINKRLDTPGVLLANLFRQHYGKVIKDLRSTLQKDMHSGAWKATNKFINVLSKSNVYKVLRPTVIENGLKYGLATGNWGVKTSRVRQGVAQVLNRMTYVATLSHLRRVNTPIEKTGKLVQPRKLHQTQWGIICPSETPEGASVGLVKNLALLANVTISTSSEPVRNALERFGIKHVDDVKPHAVFSKGVTRIFVNGDLIGAHGEPKRLYETLKFMKRTGAISVFCSIVWSVVLNEITICTEGGRFMRPLFIIGDDGKLLISPELALRVKADKVHWSDLVLTGAADGGGVIEYLDVDEVDTSMIAMSLKDLADVRSDDYLRDKYRPRYTHMEIDPSAMLGVVAGSIPFSNHNQAPRNTYQCIWFQEPVLMADGSTLPISKVRPGDSVVTFDPVTMLQSTTTVVHQHVRLTDKRMYKLTTDSGRSITATFDHLFMTYDGWMAVDDITPTTLVGIFQAPPHACHPSPIAPRSIIVGDDDASILDTHRARLVRIGVLPLWTDSAALPTIARLFGYVSSQGSVCKTSFKTLQDARKFANDMELVGFANSPEGLLEAWHEAPFTSFMQRLSTLNRDWIDASPLVRREFDSAKMAYDADKYTSTMLLREYNMYTQRSDPDTLLQYDRWIQRTRVRGDAYFVPISSKTLVSDAIIADITVASENHSFIGGDGFAIHNSAMGKQAIGVYTTNFRHRFDTMAHVLNYPQVPLVTTDTAEIINCSKLCSGINSIVAIQTYTGFNQEDSVIMNKSTCDNGNFCSSNYRSIREQNAKNHSTGEEEYFCKPDPMTTRNVKPYNYGKIAGNGFVPENDYVEAGDVIIGKVMPQKLGYNMIHKDTSVALKSNEHGFVDKNSFGDRYFTNVTGDGYTFAKVRLRNERIPTIGDKVSCYSPDHDVLTSEGWISITNLTEKHQVASLFGNELVYQHPLAIQRYKYNGQMLAVRGSGVNLVVTPDHRMYVRDNDGIDYTVRRAKDVADSSSSFSYKSVADRWTASSNHHDTFRLPGETVECDMRAWLTFFGTFTSRGWIDRCNRVSFNNVDIKFIVGACLTLDMLLSTHDGYVTVDAPSWMTKHLSLEQNVRLPRWVWALERKWCIVLLKSIVANASHCFTTTSQFADDVQRLCLHAGVSSTISKSNDGYVVRLSTRRDHTPSTTEWVWYDGSVHCCTVPGDGIIYVRRKGVPTWSGNSRHGQKGTIGMLYRREDMPFTSSGLVPDLIINPHAIPSRMTIAQLLESNLGKACCAKGVARGDGTPFRSVAEEDIAMQLQECGMERHGNEIMYNPRTGEQIACSIYVGVAYYQRLKHMADDKVHCLTPDHEVLTMRGWIPIDEVTREDEVATLVDGRRLVYEPPTDVLHFPNFIGDVYRIVSQTVELQTTLDHRMWVIDTNGDGKLVAAKDILGETTRYQHMALWDASEAGPCELGIEWCQDLPALLMLIGIWIGTPNAQEDIDTGRLRMLLDDVALHAVADCIVRLNARGWSSNDGFYNIQSPSLVEWLASLRNANGSKGFPQWIWSLCASQCRQVLAAMIHASGAVDSFSFVTSSESMADDVCRLCIHAGVWATCELVASDDDDDTINIDEWRVCIRMCDDDADGAEHADDESACSGVVGYAGPVYCLKVKSEVFMVRRNGKPVWTGNSRAANGPVVLLTRQPAEGRARDGGLRLGEMEIECLLGHGIMYFLKERMLECSDNFRVFLCKQCGMMSNVNPEKGIYMCKACNNTTHFGEARIPYACKLLLQEIQTMGIKTRIMA